MMRMILFAVLAHGLIITNVVYTINFAEYIAHGVRVLLYRKIQALKTQPFKTSSTTF